MNLSDREILELHELCGALADERINQAQQKRLGEFLKSSAEARTRYFHNVILGASLAEYAGELQSDAPASRTQVSQIRIWSMATLAAAACIVAGIYFFHLRPAPVTMGEDLTAADSEMQTGALVARVTGDKHGVWRGAPNLKPGDPLRRGQQLELAEGMAEITFDSGARVTLEGPAAIDVVSAWEAALRHGGLKATVPPQAVGFRVHHPSVEVVDLGTEFSMIAEGTGFAEVHVLKGMVEVSPANDEENAPGVLRENETRRFGKNRKGGKRDLAGQHLRLAQAAPLDRWNQKANFVHWSFDGATNAGFKGESSGIAGAFDITPAGATSADGRWNQALQLDGRHAFGATVPGISHPLPRTIAFWVRVPESSRFPDAHAIISWPIHSKKFGNRPLQTGWNRNPNQGPIGALRTELGKNYAVGVTPLCDGKWHHIAVALVPVGPGDAPLQVTQYVDGRLEGTTVRAIKSKRAASDSVLADVISLGRAPGKHGKDKGCFRGDLDELFITDRALSQPEIASLMSTNALPRFDLTLSRETPPSLLAQFSSEP